jgi:hypothetical protein
VADLVLVRCNVLIVKPLTETPDEVRTIRDDADAKILLVQLGIIDKFSKPPGLAKGAVTLCHSDHPTHWIVATRFFGHPKTTDNGFDVICCPKSRFSPADMDTVLADIKTQTFSPGIRGKIVSTKPPQN